MTTFTATLPNGQAVVTKSRRPITHAVVTCHPERGYFVFRWSAAPDTAVKELQRKGWQMNEIHVIPAA